MRRTSKGLARLAGLVAVSVVAAGCSQGGNEVTVDLEDSAAPSASAPPSNAPSDDPSDDPSTSDPGQAAPAPNTGPPEVLDVVATGLEAPWGLDFLPNGDAIVTERDTARVLRINGKTDKVTQIGKIGEARPQGEGGLLGVAVSPRFNKDRRLFFYFSAAEDNRIAVASLDKSGKKLGKLRPILTGIPLGSIHDGGRLEFGPDGFLYASTGDARTARAWPARSCG